ncbi:MAG: hypothetical protein ACM3VW_03275 [Bacteroidota bacterium]
MFRVNPLVAITIALLTCCALVSADPPGPQYARMALPGQKDKVLVLKFVPNKDGICDTLYVDKNLDADFAPDEKSVAIPKPLAVPAGKQVMYNFPQVSVPLLNGGQLTISPQYSRYEPGEGRPPSDMAMLPWEATLNSKNDVWVYRGGWVLSPSCYAWLYPSIEQAPIALGKELWLNMEMLPQGPLQDNGRRVGINISGNSECTGFSWTKNGTSPDVSFTIAKDGVVVHKAVVPLDKLKSQRKGSEWDSSYTLPLPPGKYKLTAEADTGPLAGRITNTREYEIK